MANKIPVNLPDKSTELPQSNLEDILKSSSISKIVREAVNVVSMGLGMQSISSRIKRNEKLSPDGESSALYNRLWSPPAGLLIYGAMGTGKTRLISCLMRSLQCNVVALSHSVLLSGVEGGAEKAGDGREAGMSL